MRMKMRMRMRMRNGSAMVHCLYLRKRKLIYMPLDVHEDNSSAGRERTYKILAVNLNIVHYGNTVL